MAARRRSFALAVTVPLLGSLLVACGTPAPDVSAVESRPVANETWPCPNDVAVLQSLQTAHEHLEGRPAASVAELEDAGLLLDITALAATITDGAVVGTSSDHCALNTYATLDLDARCAAELDRLSIDVFIGAMVAERLGSSLGFLEQARAVGVDHGPYLAYAWNDDEWRLERIDPSCPDEADVDAALDDATGEIEEHTCVTERKTLETATEAYYAQTGGPPADEQTLVDEGFLREEYDDYDLAPDGSVRVEPGSDCERFEQEVPLGTAVPEGAPSAADCLAQRKTLEVSIEAYWAQTGGPPADEQALVDEGLLRTQMTEFVVLPDGSVVAAPGSGCM